MIKPESSRMMDASKFEHIRPYSDEEIPEVMQRIASHELFPLLASFIFPQRDSVQVRRQVVNISTIRQFQHEIMTAVNERIIENSMSGFHYDGLEQLSINQAYLFVSNHRDIMLDSSLLQYILHTNGYMTSEITFGANLMTHPLVIDIGKANKMFRVERGGNLREFYNYSLLNSEYIRHAIVDRHQSVWIAQRNGRTKDGCDRTEPGLIRMFAASSPDSIVNALSPLNITPIAISYEWETCDLEKTIENYISLSGKYLKKEDEDLKSILAGIMAQKGEVHISICKPLEDELLEQISRQPKAKHAKLIAREIDRRIKSAYRLTPNNYIAADLRASSTLYKDKYTDCQLDRFTQRLNEVMHIDPIRYNPDAMKEIFLGIYANPVDCC